MSRTTANLLTEQARHTYLKELLLMVSARLAVPLFLVFWLADLFLAPHLKWQFLGIRLLILPIHALVTHFLRKSRTLVTTEIIGVCLISAYSVMITVMAWLTGRGTSPYYAGLNLITLGGVSFLPWRRRLVFVQLAVIYGPFLVAGALANKGEHEWQLFVVALFFMFGTVIISLVLRDFSEDLRNKEIMGEMKLVGLARQVAHDIRSPLCALKMVTESLKAIPEMNRMLIRSAAQRIEDIANDLLMKHPVCQSERGVDTTSVTSPTGEISEAWILPLVESIVSEKRVQYREHPNITIEALATAEAYHPFVKINPKEFQRILSNLINNSVEAMDSNGNVSVEVRPLGTSVTLTVRDNGKGIPANVLSKISDRGFSYGKKEGFGLGTHHARTTVESWGGKFDIQSEAGKGTTVTLTLPQTSPPQWFIPRLVVSGDKRIIVVDDERSIHTVWDKRLDYLAEPRLERLHFYSTREFRTWFENSRKPSTDEMLFLIDYEFRGVSETGADMIQALGIHDHSILVTNRHEEEAVRRKCTDLEIKLLPKNLVHAIPMSLES